MIIFKEANSLTYYLNQQKAIGKKTGFVPTMGALHKGHISLINAGKAINDLTVCSIFVNPVQFNNVEDFKHYPITIEKDIEQLILSGCDILFLPSVEEIYPSGYQKKEYALGSIETILEGHYRPGHFQGVCQVVDRLLEIIAPDILYLGQKDFQQCMVIKKLLDLTKRQKKVYLTIVPTFREEDGLAMSSRNLRLNNEERNIAPSIYKVLIEIKNNFVSQPITLSKQKAAVQLKEKGFVVDYVEIANAENLEISADKLQKSVALVAATIGMVRLIDNMLLN